VWAERGGAFTIGKPEKIIIYVKNTGKVEDSYGIIYTKSATLKGSDASNLINFVLPSNKILNVKPNETKSTTGSLVVIGPIETGSLTITVLNKDNLQRQFVLSNIRAIYPQSLNELNTTLLIFTIIFIACFYPRKNKILLFLILLNFSVAKSSYISITTSVDTPIIYNNSTKAAINIENSGDEAAYDVVAIIDSEKIYAENIYIGRLDSNQQLSKNFTLFISDGIKEGNYVGAVRVYYKDRSGYGFSAITPIQIIHKNFLLSKISLTAKDVKLEERGNTKIPLKIKNNENRDIDAKIKFYLPSEFASSKISYNIRLKPNSEKTFFLDVSNIKALKGSSYPYFVSVEYEDQYHYSEYSVGFIEVVEQKNIKSSYIIAGTALIISMILFFLGKNSKKRKR